jgi:hypothetical protein
MVMCCEHEAHGKVNKDHSIVSTTTLELDTDCWQCEVKSDDHRRTFEECAEVVLDIPPNEVMCNPEGHRVDRLRETATDEKFECRLNEEDDSLKHMAMMSCCRGQAHGKVSPDGSSVSETTHTRKLTDAVSVK